MTTDEIRAFEADHVAKIGTHDVDVIAADFTDDGVVESPSLGTQRGRQAIAQGYARWFAAFSDVELFIDSVVAEGDQAAVISRMTGTHQGEFMGLPPTGKRIEFQFVALQRFENDKIAHERRIYDFSGLLIKLGVLKVKPG